MVLTMRLLSLNPCCNGRGSKTLCEKDEMIATMRGLNPCCNGRGSKTVVKTFALTVKRVS